MLGPRLLGAYAGGSFGLGDFDPLRSDLDVFAVSRAAVSSPERGEIVARLRHEALPCPARGLEFVLYPEETARVATDAAGFLLNLNTGARMAFRVDEDARAVERHWFPIDRAIVRCAGVALYGPPPAELFAPIPRPLLVPVVEEALRWHRAAGSADAVLNACRARRFIREDVWSSKSQAGAWALGRVEDRELVATALERRRSLDPGRVERFVATVLADLGEDAKDR